MKFAPLPILLNHLHRAFSYYSMQISELNRVHGLRLPQKITLYPVFTRSRSITKKKKKKKKHVYFQVNIFLYHAIYKRSERKLW